MLGISPCVYDSGSADLMKRCPCNSLSIEGRFVPLHQSLSQRFAGQSAPIHLRLSRNLTLTPFARTIPNFRPDSPSGLSGRFSYSRSEANRSPHLADTERLPSDGFARPFISRRISQHCLINGFTICSASPENSDIELSMRNGVLLP